MAARCSGSWVTMHEVYETEKWTLRTFILYLSREDAVSCSELSVYVCETTETNSIDKNQLLWKSSFSGKNAGERS